MLRELWEKIVDRLMLGAALLVLILQTVFIAWSYARRKLR